LASTHSTNPPATLIFTPHNLQPVPYPYTCTLTERPPRVYPYDLTLLNPQTNDRQSPEPHPLRYRLTAC